MSNYLKGFRYLKTNGRLYFGLREFRHLKR